MSVQFGRWNLDGRPVEPDYLEKVQAVLAPYGPDGFSSCCQGAVSMLYGAFHTTKESRQESQPHLCRSGSILTWDGWLDNRSELTHELNSAPVGGSTDISIVAAAYEEWGTGCFATLIGDWALSIWNPNDRSLILAKDPIGTRHLYYSTDNHQVTWSSLLDPLVLFLDKTFVLEEEYVAGWLSLFPAAHLTPYAGVRSVPPSAFVVVRDGKETVSRYWDFDPGKRIRYRADAEYEEEFRHVLAEATRRRLRSDCPVLAELSGGLDSSSIVCMADVVIRRGAAETQRLDTVSYYDDGEPNLDDRSYFTRVEEKRGRTGRHIDFAGRRFFESELGHSTFTPFAKPNRADRSTKEFIDCLASQGHRVVLSGIGGDEVTGGVPTPVPELQDLIATANWPALARQLKAWALDKRKPWIHLLFEAVREFLPIALAGVPAIRRPAPWLDPAFVKRNLAALQGYPSRVKFFDSLPSFQTNLDALDMLRRQLEGDPLPSAPPYDKRYPFLDRGLLEFMFAIPREQVVRPGQRRSLMRRALVGIVPNEVLNRKRKAFAARAPVVAISGEWARLTEISHCMVGASLGVVNQVSFSQYLQKVRQGQVVPLVPLMRTLYLELWLRNLVQSGIGNRLGLPAGTSVPGVVPTLISAEKS
jgi:asparagine synthase (glutamine-hydrolysing)